MPKKICIVDDQVSLRQMVRFALNVQGLDVIEAEDGLDALRQISTQRVDLIIADWQMPKMDGLELLETLRRSDELKDIPVIVVSCRDDIESRMKARSLGVHTWMKKPFRISEIQVAVESTLGTNSSSAS